MRVGFDLERVSEPCNTVTLKILSLKSFTLPDFAYLTLMVFFRLGLSGIGVFQLCHPHIKHREYSPTTFLTRPLHLGQRIKARLRLNLGHLTQVFL